MAVDGKREASPTASGVARTVDLGNLWRRKLKWFLVTFEGKPINGKSGDGRGKG